VLPVDVLVPQVAPGAHAVECRADDVAALAALAAIEHAPSRRVVDAERAFLAELGGDCDLPAGAHAVPDGDGLRLTGLLATPDGHVVLRHTAMGSEPVALGRSVARYLLEHGGASLLEQA
jgi:hydroxymethylbilane synthase